MLCGRLRAWLSARSLLVAVLRSLIARRRFGPRARWRPLRGILTSGVGLDNLACSGVGQECSSLFIIVIGLVFMFSL